MEMVERDEAWADSHQDRSQPMLPAGQGRTPQMGKKRTDDDDQQKVALASLVPQRDKFLPTLSEQEGDDRTSAMMYAKQSAAPFDGAERFRPGDTVDLDNETQVELLHLGEDVYWASLYSFICDLQDITSNRDFDGEKASTNIMRFTFCLGSLLLNYFLQVFVLLSSYNYVAAPAVHRVQSIYQEYHEDTFDADGAFNWTKWWEWPEHKRNKLCGMVFSRHAFLFCMLALWWMACLNEFGRTKEMFHDIKRMLSTSLADLKSGSFRMVVQGEDDQLRIERMLPSVKWCIYIFIIFPKVLISWILLVTGTLYLAGTDNFADLILNAVALQFVLNIDDWMFEAVFPRSIKEQMSNAVIVTPHEKSNLAGNLGTSLLYYAVILGGVAFYLTPWGQAIPFFGILPSYRYDADCPLYWKEQVARVCEPVSSLRGVDCFPTGHAAVEGRVEA